MKKSLWMAFRWNSDRNNGTGIIVGMRGERGDYDYSGRKWWRRLYENTGCDR